MVLRGSRYRLPPKGSQPWGPSAPHVSALSAKGRRVAWKAHVSCCRGLSSCSRVLSFVSCLQMQQKVKVTTCFDLLIFLFCFGLYTSSSSPPLPSPHPPLLSFLVATLHPAPVPFPGAHRLG